MRLKGEGTIHFLKTNLYLRLPPDIQRNTTICRFKMDEACR